VKTGANGEEQSTVKWAMQQARSMVLKVRASLVAQRTLLVNTLRGHATEFGVTAGKGLSKIGPLLAAIEQETAIPSEATLWPSYWASRSQISTPGSKKSMSN
jgi:transposase